MSTFILINILLILAWFLFKLSQSLVINASTSFTLRYAQFLVGLALIAPVILHMIPGQKLPVIENAQFQALPESGDKIISQSLVTTKKILSEAENHSNQFHAMWDFDFIDLIWVIWLLGFIYFFSRLLINYLKLRSLLLRSIIIRARGRFRVVVSQEIVVPFSVRLISAGWVVIPIDLIGRKKDFSLSLKHEIQHHRQRDTLWAMIIELMTCLFYFNLAIHVWKTTIIELQELACDDALTGQKDVSSHEYGSCLLRVAETALSNRQMYVGTTSMAAVLKNSKHFKKFLVRRIEMIMDEKKTQRKWVTLSTGILMSLITISVAISAETILRNQVHKINSGRVIVDPEIQKISDLALMKALKRTRGTAGFVIVSDPLSGKILAVSNIDLKNKRNSYWALSDLMESASLAKTLVIAKAIDEKKTTPFEKHNCENGTYRYKDSVYRDWKNDGWDQLTTTETLGLSSDICSIKIGEKLGEESALKMLKDFGFGVNGSASAYPMARVGELPAVGGQVVPQITAGFGFKSSVLEINQAFGAIANGGYLMRPILANSHDSQKVRRVLSEEGAKQMRAMLEEVVISGTAKDRGNSDLYTTAGKTATARLNDFKSIDWYGTKKMGNIASFIGFSPVSKPRIQVFVGILNPNSDNTGAHGSVHAAPVFKEVVENVLTHLKVSPDKI